VTREPLPDPFAGEPDWAPRPPRPVLLRRASDGGDLRGQRVVLGLPGLGWRSDLRADERVVQGSRTLVPVIAEHEWCRSEAEQIEVFAPLVPVERVWVETLAGARPTRQRPGGSRLVSMDAPAKRPPVPVMEADSVAGRRVVEVVDGIERRDLRAVTEVHSGAEGDICIRVTTEVEWYRWAWSGRSPRTLEMPVHVVWIE
jgi:hypothetical protein